jgi:t-SNARE complex subunit (syntaxin)
VDVIRYTRIANINTRKLIEVIKAEIKLKETKIQELAQMIDSLEETINDQGRRLDVLDSDKTKRPDI